MSTVPSKKLNKWDIIIVTFVAIILLGVIVFGLWGNILIKKPHVNVGEIGGIIAPGSAQVTFQIYNSGEGNANNVYAMIQMLYPDGVTTIASKELFIGNLAPGESKTVKTIMIGDFPPKTPVKIIPRFDQ